MLNKYTTSVLLSVMMMMTAVAQDGYLSKVERQGAREIVAEINGGVGTLYLKRGAGSALFTLKEKNDGEDHGKNINVHYHVENGIGYLTVDLNTDGDDMNALACLLQGNDSRTWYMTINDNIPVRFDVTMGAGKASLDLTGIHVRDFSLDAGAGTIRIAVDKPNREEIKRVAITAGVGSLTARKLGNLRFHELDFEGGLGTYRLDCTGKLGRKSRIMTDVGVGSLTIVLPEGVGAKALANDNFLSSTKMYRFIRKNDDVYITKNFSQSSRRVLLDLQSGMGSISVRWAK